MHVRNYSILVGVVGTSVVALMEHVHIVGQENVADWVFILKVIV
jgi:hypothetical protein